MVICCWTFSVSNNNCCCCCCSSSMRPTYLKKMSISVRLVLYYVTFSFRFMMARMDVCCAAYTTTTTCYYRLNEVGGGMREMGEVKTVPKKKKKNRLSIFQFSFLFFFFFFPLDHDFHENISKREKVGCWIYIRNIFHHLHPTLLFESETRNKLSGLVTDRHRLMPPQLHPHITSKIFFYFIFFSKKKDKHSAVVSRDLKAVGCCFIEWFIIYYTAACSWYSSSYIIIIIIILLFRSFRFGRDWWLTEAHQQRPISSLIHCGIRSRSFSNRIRVQRWWRHFLIAKGVPYGSCWSCSSFGFICWTRRRPLNNRRATRCVEWTTVTGQWRGGGGTIAIFINNNIHDTIQLMMVAFIFVVTVVAPMNRVAVREDPNGLALRWAIRLIRRAFRANAICRTRYDVQEHLLLLPTALRRRLFLRQNVRCRPSLESSGLCQLSNPFRCWTCPSRISVVSVLCYLSVSRFTDWSSRLGKFKTFLTKPSPV